MFNQACASHSLPGGGGILHLCAHPHHSNNSQTASTILISLMRLLCAEYSMHIPPYMSRIQVSDIRSALERLVTDLVAQVDLSREINSQHIQHILIRFASEEDLQVEVFRVLNGLSSTPPRILRNTSLVHRLSPSNT